MDESTRDYASLTRGEVFKLLGCPTRMQILVELLRGMQTVTQIADHAGENVKTISKHLQPLQSAFMVEYIPEGNCHLYRLGKRVGVVDIGNQPHLQIRCGGGQWVLLTLMPDPDGITVEVNVPVESTQHWLDRQSRGTAR